MPVFGSMSQYCPYCQALAAKVSKFGSFYRRSDRKRLQRFRCKACLRCFSQATFQKAFQQKKRQLNPVVEKLLVSCVSQRRIAFLLGVSRTTVARKLEFLALKAQLKNLKTLNHSQLSCIQFDDLESFEHSKCKPLSVIMAVEASTRKILGFEVSSMPAKGHLSKIARKKYGPRKDERAQGRRALFNRLKPRVKKGCEIFSDQSPHYPEDVKRFFPEAFHKTTPGRRGCVVGQGELKAGGFDPLFTLNHTFAMLRDNLKRLSRRTWCTTKKAENLAKCIQIYVAYHNAKLIQKL